MPIFEYRCRECGTTFEKIQRLASEEEACPRCGGAALRTVSAPVAGSSGPSASAAPPSCGGSGFT